MRVLILLCLGGLLASAAEDIDVVLNYDTDPVLKDEAKWKVLFDCYMDRGPCGDYQGVKDASLRLYINKCEKCTPEQKEKFENVLKQFAVKYPKDYAEILSKVSPKTDE